MSEDGNKSAVDVGIVTVIGPELEAVQRALNIENRQRIRIDGTLYWRSQIHSRLEARDLELVTAIIARSTQANASAAVTLLIERFEPALIILVGISAGKRDTIKIGDILVPREVVDMSENVAEAGQMRPRAHSWPLPHPVAQMWGAFQRDAKRLQTCFEEVCGRTLIVPPGKEAEFKKHVTLVPAVKDNPIGTADLLVRDPAVFEKYDAVHQGVRGSEMEAGGCVKACETRSLRKAWMVIRGISDFGDEFKDDQFHHLASSAAASLLKLFLEEGFDSDLVRPRPIALGSLGPTIIGPSGAGTVAPTSRSIAVNLLSEELDLCEVGLNESKNKELDQIREVARTGDSLRARTLLGDFRAGTANGHLNEHVLGAATHLDAALLIQEGKIDEARKLIESAAKEFIDVDWTPLSALLENEANGVETALKLLEQPKTIDGWHLRMEMLIEAGKSNEALDIFSAPPKGVTPNEDSIRISATLDLHTGNMEKALSQVEKLLKSNTFNAKLTAIRILHFSSFTSAALSAANKSWPSPVDLSLVKRDQVSLERLRQAVNIADGLLTSGFLRADLKNVVEGWKLACLANDAQKQPDAEGYCFELLQADPIHSLALRWAASRDWKLDLGPNIDALTRIFIR